MTIVTAQMSLSLDGCYSGPRDPAGSTAEGPQGWMTSPEALGFFRVTRWVLDAMAWRQRLGFEGGERDVNHEIMEGYFESSGAYVMGRRMFDGGEVPWGDEPPFHAPVFVVTHRPRQTVVKEGGTSFTFVTDGLASAIEQARAAARDNGGKNVAIAGGGTLLRQAIGAGLVDRLDLHIAPVVLGDGQRLFDPDGLGLGGDEAIELTPTRVIETPGITHVSYDVKGRAKLELDERVLGGGDTTAADAGVDNSGAASGES